MMRFLALVALLVPLVGNTQVLLPEEVVARVLEHHPIALAAGLRIDAAEAEQMKARGGFDPKLAGDFRAKEFEDKLYYSVGDAGLKIPTPIGMDVDLGYQNTGGIFLNPEQNLPIDGLLGAGVSLELGQGLIIDVRRAALRQAEFALTLGESEQRLMINQLVSEALMAYWAWFEAWHREDILRGSVTLAQTRRDGVVQSAIQGDKPFQDTLEAGIQVLNRRQLQMEAAQELMLKRALLEAYLWDTGNAPLQLNPAVLPPAIDAVDGGIPELPAPQGSWLADHPTLLQGQALIGQKDVDLRWKREQLKPEFGLKYQWLASPQTLGGEDPVTVRDAAVGVDLAFPLFLRKERASIRLTEIDLATKRYELSDKQRSLELKSTALRSGWALMDDRREVQRKAVQNAGSLLQGERQLFQVGESSLFLVNAREQYYINTQLKQVEILRKMAENRVKILELEAALAPLPQQAP